VPRRGEKKGVAFNVLSSIRKENPLAYSTGKKGGKGEGEKKKKREGKKQSAKFKPN